MSGVARGSRGLGDSASRWRALVIVFAALLVTLPRAAYAVENEHHVGVAIGGATLVMSDKTDLGGVLAAHWTYGLSDQFDFLVEANGALLSSSEHASPGHPRIHPGSSLAADVGLAYVLDVLQWVPYGGALVGGTTLLGGDLEKPKPLPELVLALGLDYRVSRSLAVGVALRQRMLLTDLSTYPDSTTLLVRVEETWGW